ncbi:MAG: aspartate kinase [Candidatus Nezhaarchaeota archaeon]|nr:aspartate kinase [Candidatus Nezhaarchaeota archaeon]
MRAVMKFGGRCVESGAMIRRSCTVVRDHVRGGWQIIAVVSAMAGVTDSLLEALRRAEAGGISFTRDFVNKLRERHLEAVEDAIASDEEVKRRVREEIEEEVGELERALLVMCYLREVTPRGQDYVLSFGERLSTRIFTGSLLDLGVRAKYLTGWEAGIVTDDRFNAARPIMPLTYELLRARLNALLMEGVTPVVTGFIASTVDGAITTLGRGGSDLTATIIGAALGVDEVVLWKDVEGVMTADPKLVPEARVVPSMSYEEITELAYFGAKVIHPLALYPVAEANVPIRVKSLFNPLAKGTLITEASGEEGVVKAVTMVRDVATITVSSPSMLEAPTMTIEVLNALKEVGAQPLMISQGSSQASASLVIPRSLVDKAVRSIRRKLTDENYKIEAEADVCIIAAIGAGMKGKPGVAARVFKAVANEGINVRMIAQGSSELNISFVVKEADGVRALRALHKEFGLHGNL